MSGTTKIIHFDLEQEKIRTKLLQLQKDLEKDKNFFSSFFNQQKTLKSLYIYGTVGTGKTSLMQDFYKSLKKTPKIYFHFNSFMRLIHETLRDIRLEEKKYKDELVEAVGRIIDDKKLLCFDEFQVLDIADAMLLNRIFSYLFSKKIVVIFTSNSAPRDLYQNGLQREIFIDFIDNILLKNCEVLKLSNGIDYRSLYRKNLNKRYFVSNTKNRTKIKEIIKTLTNAKPTEPRILTVWGREILIKKTYKNIAILTYEEICKKELAASDYQAICREFDLIFLGKIPIFSKEEDRNEMRRFMLFIDEIYENKTALIVLARVKIDKIYKDRPNDNSFERTISRLKEIKSDEYWANSKFIT